MNTVAKLTAMRMDPMTFVRYAATSRAAQNNTAAERRQIALARYYLRLKLHRMRRPPHTRLSTPLFEAKMNAIQRLRLTPAQIAARKRRVRRLQAGAAHLRYQLSGSNRNWNAFVRAHVLAGGQPNVNRASARRIYN
jgi:hypothetical protein